MCSPQSKQINLIISSDSWNNVSDDEKLRIEYFTKAVDGVFFMKFEDFYHVFDSATLCTIGPDLEGDGQETSKKSVVAL